MRRELRLGLTALSASAVILSRGAPAAYAQAGSTGGTLGKADQSLSGGLPKPGAAVEPKKTKGAAPEAQKAGCARIATRMTVTAFTKDQVVMQRADTAGFGLVTGHYIGKRVGNKVPGGTAQISNGFTVMWEATW
jgi:hypothetical protein